MLAGFCVHECVVGVDEEQRRNLTLRGVPSVCAQSAVWEKTVRDNVTNNKISEQVYLSITSHTQLPSSSCNLTVLVSFFSHTVEKQPRHSLFYVGVCTIT